MGGFFHLHLIAEHDDNDILEILILQYCNTVITVTALFVIRLSDYLARIFAYEYLCQDMIHAYNCINRLSKTLPPWKR